MNPQNNSFYKLNMLVLGKSEIPDLLQSGFKISYKNEKFLTSEMRAAAQKNGEHMTEQQRLKLIDDFKSAIELHGNMGNPKLIKILKNDGDIPKLEGRYIAERTLLTYIGLARCRLGLDAKSPDPQRGDRSGKIYKKEDIDKAVDLYAKKYSISELAKEMGWSRSKTRRILMMNGAKVRSQSEGRLIHWTEVKKQRKVKTDDIS